MEISPSGSIVGASGTFVTINCCPHIAELSQLSVNIQADNSFFNIKKS